MKTNFMKINCIKINFIQINFIKIVFIKIDVIKEEYTLCVCRATQHPGDGLGVVGGLVNLFYNANLYPNSGGTDTLTRWSR